MNTRAPGDSVPPPVPADRILIVRPSALGDVCRTVPVLASLRAAYPSARIDWLVQDGFAPAIEHHPALTGVVPFPRKHFGELVKRMKLRPVLDWLGTLRRTKYDLVIDCQGLARSGLFTWGTRAPRRVGYGNAPEGAWLGYTIRPKVDIETHAVDRMLSLVSAAGVTPVRDMRLYTARADLAAVETDPDLRGADGKLSRYLLVAPTSRWPGKRWGQGRFADAIRALLAAGVEKVVLVGAKAERAQCEQLTRLAASEPRVIDRIGGTSVGGLMALVERSSVVLCNDSAVLHMAVGFDRPIVALYGPTLVRRVGPYGRSADVLQHVRQGDRTDHKDLAAGTQLMDRITVREVLAAVLERYSRAGTRG